MFLSSSVLGWTFRMTCIILNLDDGYQLAVSMPHRRDRSPHTKETWGRNARGSLRAPRRNREIMCLAAHRASGRHVCETRSPRVAEHAWIVDRAQPERGGGMNIEFLATVAVVAPDPPASRKLYVDALGLPLESEGGDYHHSEQIAGCKSFGIWPLGQAAQACFGTAQWPAERPVPQVSIEFDVPDAVAVGPAARELEQAGYDLLHPPRKEPW